MNPLDLLFRWLYVAGAAFVVGSFLYARFVVWPAAAALDAGTRSTLWASISSRFRPWAIGSLVVVFASGLYNFMRVLASGVSGPYHMVFGIKFLLALHVFAMLLVLSRPPLGDAADDIKRRRLAFSTAISGLVILALGAYLRTLHA